MHHLEAPFDFSTCSPERVLRQECAPYCPAISSAVHAHKVSKKDKRSDQILTLKGVRALRGYFCPH